MERHFEADHRALRERLLVMGGLAESMIHQSVNALVSREESLVEQVLAHEEEMDLLCIEIDDRCFTLLALQQPMASDLRFLVAAIKINSDLERIADQTVSIALHKKFGFVECGRQVRVGYKFDRWLDVVFMQLML